MDKRGGQEAVKGLGLRKIFCIPENKADGGFESRIRAGLATQKLLETSCKL